MMGIVEKGFDKPSPVQEECFPIALAGKECLAESFWVLIAFLIENRKIAHCESQERNRQNRSIRDSNSRAY